ncbi:hypothetical protein [Microbulbifer sp. 2201CG32-9]|uniref:hypothetical protein n=1 Tax=unclassified Microbulbifer TaxID=2619833 RepID=UPI00345C3780
MLDLQTEFLRSRQQAIDKVFSALCHPQRGIKDAGGLVFTPPFKVQKGILASSNRITPVVRSISPVKSPLHTPNIVCICIFSIVTIAVVLQKVPLWPSILYGNPLNPVIPQGSKGEKSDTDKAVMVASEPFKIAVPFSSQGNGPNPADIKPSKATVPVGAQVSALTRLLGKGMLMVRNTEIIKFFIKIFFKLCM